jgi:PAS domain-containing protein
MLLHTSSTIDVYLEIGKKRVFAGAIDWPGWARSGPDEASALQALCDYGQHYERALTPARLDFWAPVDVSAFVVVERLEGNATTDFGAPDAISTNDLRPVEEVELRRFQALLEAYWQIFDSAVRAANGKELRTGPRGGGRSLEGIVEHVLEAEAAYLERLGWKLKQVEAHDTAAKATRVRQATLEGLAASAHGEIPARGPRGGLRWVARRFVRRAGWHVLDHAWEIEERSQDHERT